MGLPGAPLCACCFVSVFQCHALKRHRQVDKCNFFSCTDFINSVISQYNGQYGKWITTQNVRNKIMHALHFKWTILIKYFSSYIKKCQTGTNFFGWVYLCVLLQLTAGADLAFFQGGGLTQRRCGASSTSRVAASRFFCYFEPRKWCFPGIYTNHMMAFFLCTYHMFTWQPKWGGGGGGV